VQKLSRFGQPLLSADPSPMCRGYLLRSSVPICLRAVLVGLHGNTSGAKVRVAGATIDIIEKPLRTLEGVPQEWCSADPVVTHVSDGFHVRLSTLDASIMITGESEMQFKYMSGDNSARSAGPFSVTSKTLNSDGTGFSNNSYSICMCLVYEEE